MTTHIHVSRSPACHHVTCLPLLFAIIAAAMALPSASAADLGPSFTYQGRLKQNGAPVNGLANVTYRLFNAVTGGSQIGSITHNNVAFADGLFSDVLNFGDVFNGRAFWLEIAVNGVTLTPRQELTSAPSALTLKPGAVVAGVSQSPVLTVRNDSTSPSLYGLYARVQSADSVAIVGDATASSGLGTGVQGNSAASNGTAVLARSTAASGTPFGVRADVNAPNGYAGYFQGGRNYFEGHVGIGNAAPSWPLHITSSQAVARLDTSSNTNGSVIELRSNAAGTPAFVGAINFVNNLGQAPGQIGYTGDDQMTFRAGGFERMRITDMGTVCFGDVTPLALPIFVNSAGSEIFMVDRTGNGHLILFTQNGTGLAPGSISIVNGVVSYNAFTGSHYAWVDSERDIARSTLVRLTGENRRIAPEAESEIVYGIEPCTRVNDPACLGAYLGSAGEAPSADRDLHLVMAVGNGEMSIVDGGAGDIQPGDYLISSDVAGCAMRDDAKRFPVGHIVGRAAERIEWAAVEPDADGIRRNTISVLFESFVRDSTARSLEAMLAAQQQEIDALRSQMASLQSLANRLAAASADAP